ncbi:MAG: choline dehydrogenase [Rhodospirillaceae bacterium]|jgi:choline dehydrogenase|nr:choline dehydrogenase [Rhodospirillaceae bacterium]MBT5944753.1 choline dehydrogenase [Rhodospirillaceae bacterium]MBT6536740.1 choline dehydrogenase [Rhodospirillaceae bacterium]MBT7360367.1 choline dehydrogenase [Rhodospirillaceae bacterium]
MADEFDYIIIGAGSAGSILANRLSAGDATVCLLEAGPPDRNPWIHIPAGFTRTLANPKVNWLFESEPSEGTAGRPVYVPRGKTLGGSSSINGHIYNRGQRMDYDSWAQEGNRGWGYADILPYFKRGERRIGGPEQTGDEDFHGRDGELPVTDIDGPEPICDAFIDGAVGIGIPRNDDYNGATQAGVGYFQRVIENGRRVSAARAFLHPVKHRPNLDIRTNAHTQRILFDGARAVGVLYKKGDQTIELRARQEIILSSGSVGSPQLLQISGVGPAALLKDLGVEVVHDLPGVGENLSDHYLARMTARVKNARTINERARGLSLVKEVADYALRRKGLLAMSPSQVFVFWKSHPAMDQPDMQLIFTPATYKAGRIAQLEDEPGMTAATFGLRPLSRGYIRARTSNAGDAPIIQPNYLDHETDQQVTVAGLRLDRQLLTAPELAQYYDHEVVPGAELQTDDELLDFARSYGTTVFHLVGTCRMGAADRHNVVSDELKVHGIEGLRVVDASVMPTMPSANTNAATMMIAEKGADLILGKAPPPAAIL